MSVKDILNNFGSVQQKANSEGSLDAYKDFMSELASATIQEKQEREEKTSMYEQRINNYANDTSNENSYNKYLDDVFYENKQNDSNYTSDSSNEIEQNKINESFTRSGNDNINGIYDYDNVVITEDNIKTLIKYIFDVASYFEQCAKMDEEKNEPLKLEFRNYSFRERTINSSVSITMGKNDYRFNNYYTFQNFCNTNKLKNISYIYIYLTINFSTGMRNELIDYDSKINITIKPFKINLTRKSNIPYDKIDKFESDLKSMFDSFQKVDSIF